MSDQVNVGSRWRRKRDGVRIQVVNMNTFFGDCYWEQVDGKGRGAIYIHNLLKLYAPDVADDQH